MASKEPAVMWIMASSFLLKVKNSPGLLSNPDCGYENKAECRMKT
jgi:hypothetical protein